MAKKVELTNFHIVNYKRIDELQKEVNGNHFIITGANGQGKTSVTQAIRRNAIMIAPEEMAQMPIRFGQKNSKVNTTFKITDETGKITHILVQNTIRPSGMELKVIDLSNDGELKPPVSRLQALLGGVSVDVSALFHMPGKAQFDYLFKILGSKETIEAQKEELKSLYSARTEANRVAKQRQQELSELNVPIDLLQEAKNLGMYGEEIPFEEKEPNPLDLRLRKVEDERFNERWDSNKKAEEGLVAQRTENDNKIAELKRQIEQLEVANIDLDRRIADADAWFKEHPKVKIEQKYAEEQKKFDADVLAYQQRKKENDEYNEKVRLVAAHAEKKLLVIDADEKAKEAQDKYSDKVKQIRDVISSLTLSSIVPELELFDETDDETIKNPRLGLYYLADYNEKQEPIYLPFNVLQISYAKGLIALVKLSAYINHGRFNMFHIPMWAEMDSNSKAEVLRFAEENKELNIQFAIEEVADKTQIEINLIESGLEEAEDAAE